MKYIDPNKMDKGRKSYLEKFKKRKPISVTMKQPTAQDDLILGVILFGDELNN